MHAVSEIHTDVAILGAGMSGLCMAIQLKRCGIDDFLLIEKSDGLGGTWWDNRYPGAQVDVPAPAYSFSFAPNPHWTHRFADAPEIQAYQQRLAQDHGLLPHLQLGHAIVSAAFDAATGRWRLVLDDGRVVNARFFVCSTGPLSQPRWPAGADLSGQRIGVIGTGSTASQLVPALAASAAHLSLFQRTPNWVLPRVDRRYGRLDRWLMRLPGYARLARGAWVQVLELGRRGFDDGTLARRLMLRAADAHLRRQVADPQLRERLRPRYALGCKRIIYSNDYYPALTQPHCSLVTAPIREVTPDGIITADGQRHPLDVLVCATGFDTARPLAQVRITGLDGLTLEDAWREGQGAYLGMSVPGFPNFFLMLGPNTGTGHTSTLLFIEPQVQHALACMHRVRETGRRWIAVRAGVAAAQVEALQQRLAGSVWSQCSSWYRDPSGRIFAIWPGYTREYVQAVRRPDEAAYELG